MVNKNFHLRTFINNTDSAKAKNPIKLTIGRPLNACLGGWMDGNKLFIASQSCTHSMQWASRELATPLVQLISIFYLQLASWLLCMMLSLVAAIFLWMWCDNFLPSITFNLKGQLTNKPKNSFCLTLCNVNLQLNQLHTHWFIAKVKVYLMKT